MSARQTFYASMRPLFPFFWRPRGVVPSLEDLSPADKVVAKHDVSLSVSGKNSGHHPLIVAELAGGRIIGDLRLVANADDAVVGAVQGLSGSTDSCNHYLLHRRRFRLPRNRRGTALLLGAANSDNYYHWLLDSLPRWRMLQAAKYADYDYVLLHSQPHHFQDETLDRLNVPTAKRLRCNKNFVYQFDRLVVPAMPFPDWGITPWACEWVRSLFLERSGGPDRIYLSRRDAVRRPLVNEAELEARLQKLGFVCVQSGKLSVAEQAGLFSAAKWVVAPHGAGLANLVFAPSGARVIELLPPESRNPCYQHLARACGLLYTSLIGTRTHKFACRDDHHAEFTIDVSEVLRLAAKAET